MEAVQMPPAQARLKLTILDKQAEAKNSWEFYSEMKNLGLPDEVIEILKKILRITSKSAGKTIAIGKIVVLKLLEYIAAHPLQVAGLALSLYPAYALGVAVHGLFALVPGLAQIPFIGSLLAKLALVIATLCKTIFVPAIVALPVVGTVAGEILDNKFPEVSQSLQNIAKDFFETFGQILNAVKDEIDLKSANHACV